MQSRCMAGGAKKLSFLAIFIFCSAACARLLVHVRFDTEYDRANVPPYNGNDPPPAPGSLKRSLFQTLLNEVQNKGTQGVRARYGAELPPIISIVRYPGRPVISVPDRCPLRTGSWARRNCFPGPRHQNRNRTFLSILRDFGPPKAVLLVNRAFVPPEKGGF